MEYTVGIFLYDERNKKILIVHPTNGANHWSVPKGLKDGNEDIFTAGLRELKEETNISIGEIKDYIKYVEGYTVVKYPKRSKYLAPFLIMIDYDVTKFDLKCESMVEIEGRKPFPEVDDFKWVTLDEALPLVHVTQRITILKIRKGLES